MEKALNVMVIVAIAFSIFFLLARYQGGFSLSPKAHIDDANKNERCAKFEKPIEDLGNDRNMSYGDRARQFVSGCW